MHYAFILILMWTSGRGVSTTNVGFATQESCEFAGTAVKKINPARDWGTDLTYVCVPSGYKGD